MILVEETDHRFYVDESTIPGAGKGLFAKEKLRKGDYLEIIGVYVGTDEIATQCTHFARDYKFAGAGEKYTRLIIPLGYAGMVNHAPKEEQINALIDYRKGAKRNPAAGSCVYMFIRDIKAGEEIIGYYGEEWKGIFNWTDRNTEVLKGREEQCKTFLGYGLYNLNLIKHLME